MPAEERARELLQKTQGYVSQGLRVRVTNLESEEGALLNGLTGTVTGCGSFNEALVALNGGAYFRVHVLIDGTARAKKFRLMNLLRNVDAARSGQPGEALLPPKVARQIVASFISKAIGKIDQAPMYVKDRYLAATVWLDAITEQIADTSIISPMVVARCGALGRVPAGEFGDEARYSNCWFGCCGDGNVVFERFADGIIGVPGGDDLCVMCLEPILSENRADAVGLPCRHKFHRNCIKTWFGTRDTENKPPDCPTCRHQLYSSGDSFIADYNVDDMLIARHQLYFEAGICECCIAVRYEGNPYVYVDSCDGTLVQKCRRSDFALAAKYDIKYPPREPYPLGFIMRRKLRFVEGKEERFLHAKTI
uniref:RING-type domain-containing protein n=1 Tax=Mantoniella antarctica TaxID=81844 RepID=A0A7S0X7L5_9CHLO|mmetsp:Transcript_25757/g.64423  ORF Transcript_25757/g.64423 Transcript_25757/m.64423 type:complete len:365 (+) Transcript_25757:163-1257(+)